MKKNAIKFLIIISILSLITTLNIFTNIYKFNPAAVKYNIKYLSSDYFKGRLAGTLENMEACAYIKNQFKEIGLLPFEGDYYDPFDSSYPHKLEEDPYLKILDKKGAVIKEYKYGSEYKEEMLKFKKNHVVFSSKDFIKEGDEVLQITKGSDNFLFFVPKEGKLTFRSSFMASEPSYQSMYIMLSRETLKEVKSYLSKNYIVSCYIPFETRETKLNNVVGYIKGKDIKAPPVIISAHFDHVGSDVKGTVYNGALDNASGISFLLELARYITSLGTPDRNIIFIAFNGEEFGLLGSRHFVEKYLYKIQGAKVYNFDMIGSSAVPLSIMGGRQDSDDTKFVRSIVSTLNKVNVDYKLVFEDSSDHEAFRKAGIDAVTFCDSDMSKIHTPEDEAQYIDSSAIGRAFRIASKEIIREGFDNNIFLMYYENIIIFSGLGIILFSIVYKVKISKEQTK